MTVLIRVVPRSDGAWRVAVGRHDQSPVEGRVSAELVEEVARITAELDASGSDDGAVSKLEEELGQALATALHGTGELSRACSALIGAARLADARVPLVVDAAGPLARLPWELIADAPDGDPFEGADLGLVLRRAPAGLPSPRHEVAGIGLRQLRWCPSPEVPACAERLEALAGIARSLSPIRSVDVGEEPPEAEEGWADLLHLVLHAEQLDDQLRQAIEALPALLAQARLVIVELSDAERVDLSEIAPLGPRLVGAGAGACVAPRRAVSSDAARAFNSGLYDALISGRPASEAVVAGRRRVRALQLGRPGTRWHDLVMTVSSSMQPLEPPFLHGSLWLPEGWPNPDSGAAALLRRARELANDHGFVGLEHLALAMDLVKPQGYWSERVRSFLARHRRELAQRPEGLKQRYPRLGSDWSGTPRLRRMGESLPRGFSVEDLWSLALADHGGPLHVLSPTLGLPPDRPQPVPEGWAVARAEALEVVGGPEDGLAIAVGARVARWNQFGAQRAEALLYDQSARYDASLSRSPVLVWLGKGELELGGPRDAGLTRFKLPGWLSDDDNTDYGDDTPLVERARRGELLSLRKGDVLALTPLTRLRAK
ncbi:MAG: hypothetical protein H6741_29330 [Alphaproteobacteria bacterium]|nr:hypothetical protein [Alphaproteobacteria bacterium]MCB9796823.1 hypothetical protein [Alphaproteobacteria bacterium]